MIRCLLTGAGGSIGCHVLMHFLHNTDWDIVCLDSFRHKGLTDRIGVMLDAHPEFAPRVKVYTHDLAAPISTNLGARMGTFEYVVNMASLSDVHDSIVNPADFITNNVALMVNVLEWARTQPSIKAFMQLSTDEVYGPTDGVTMHKEWDPIVPSNPYSASKASQEAICIAYWRTFGVPLIIVNLMNNFGEMQSPAKFPVIVQKKVRLHETVVIHGDDKGNVGSRFYIHSRNSADAFLHLLRLRPPHLHRDGSVDKPDRYNIVGDKQVDNVSFARLIANMLDIPLKYQLQPSAVSRPGHDYHYGLNGDKLHATGWKSPMSLEDSLANVVEWQEEHPEWLK